MESLTVGFWIILASEVLAAWVIWRLWRSSDHAFFKVSLSLIALVPVLGPVIALWASNFPSAAPPVLRVPVGRGYFYDRSIGARISAWRYFAEELEIERSLYTNQLFLYELSTNAGQGPWHSLLTSFHASECVHQIG